MPSPADPRISRTPDIRGGKACMAGHRIRVHDVVAWHEHQGLTADQIVSHFPGITLADVQAALAYCFDHIEEIREEMRPEAAFADEARGRTPSSLEAKLRHRRLEEAS